MAKQKWEQSAVKHPGAFTAEAKRAGMSVAAYAQKMQNAPGKTGKRARLALTFERQARQNKQGM